MAEWLFDKLDNATLILDDDCIRNRSGVVVGWLSNNGAFSINGNHIGWFERGVVYDRNNSALGFTYQADGYIPSRPGLAGVPGMPGFLVAQAALVYQVCTVVLDLAVGQGSSLMPISMKPNPAATLDCSKTCSLFL